MIFAGNRAFVPRTGASSDLRGIYWFIAVGICNGLGMLAMYAALNCGQVSVVSPLVATYPLFTLALSAIFLREEKFGPRVLLGVALTVAGVLVLARA
jgi:drug/metabolite transporter (DMT)-like permease